ncbi:hypothetical protein DLJ48_04130 [Oenococcus sicerae]|uniref:Uncharacterized protein n=1 Tax=Oenococcus sicerae TaxID=2203724 RepID=A0AAJ1R9V0_9LACO|nr:hypothetical protein [Oenococcus sicerae]MDN6900160.1 hypothetical protein [Oenococcus sicerae]QAS69766.1 hypothetical protein DLJ48_04130 [Oenococcus sicerae]
MQNNDSENKSGFSRFLDSIPAVLSSTASIMIFLFLFVYLFIFGLLGFIPGLKFLEPSNTTQLILGNYTNVLSALGAAIAAGVGSSVHKHVREHRKQTADLQTTVDRLEKKIDQLSKQVNETK